MGQPGRVLRYRNSALTLPADLLVPTCRRCRHQILSFESVPELQARLEATYRADLCERASVEIARLSRRYSQHRLEVALDPRDRAERRELDPQLVDQGRGRERADEELLIAGRLGDRERARAREIFHQRGVDRLAGLLGDVEGLDQRIERAQGQHGVAEGRAHDLVHGRSQLALRQQLARTGSIEATDGRLDHDRGRRLERGVVRRHRSDGTQERRAASSRSVSQHS